MSLLMQRRFWFWVLTAGTIAVVILGSRLLKGPALPDNLPVYGKVADFSLTERGGQTVTAKDLHGKIWIANFIFTRCGGICPMMSGRMKMIQEKMKDRPDISLVSFSVDPEFDTPEVLKKYADRYEADPKRWLFLTGDKAQIHTLSQQHFHLAIADIPLDQREVPDQGVDHSSRFVLVDEQGQIRGYYASEELDFLDKLTRDAARLERE